MKKPIRKPRNNYKQIATDLATKLAQAEVLIDEQNTMIARLEEQRAKWNGNTHKVRDLESQVERLDQQINAKTAEHGEFMRCMDELRKLLRETCQILYGDFDPGAAGRWDELTPEQRFLRKIYEGTLSGDYYDPLFQRRIQRVF